MRRPPSIGSPGGDRGAPCPVGGANIVVVGDSGGGEGAPPRVRSCNNRASISNQPQQPRESQFSTLILAKLLTANCIERRRSRWRRRSVERKTLEGCTTTGPRATITPMESQPPHSGPASSSLSLLFALSTPPHKPLSAFVILLCCTFLLVAPFANVAGNDSYDDDHFSTTQSENIFAHFDDDNDGTLSSPLFKSTHNTLNPQNHDYHTHHRHHHPHPHHHHNHHRRHQHSHREHSHHRGQLKEESDIQYATKPRRYQQYVTNNDDNGGAAAIVVVDDDDDEGSNFNANGGDGNDENVFNSNNLPFSSGETFNSQSDQVGLLDDKIDSNPTIQTKNYQNFDPEDSSMRQDASNTNDGFDSMQSRLRILKSHNAASASPAAAATLRGDGFYDQVHDDGGDVRNEDIVLDSSSTTHQHQRNHHHHRQNDHHTRHHDHHSYLNHLHNNLLHHKNKNHHRPNQQQQRLNHHSNNDIINPSSQININNNNNNERSQQQVPEQLPIVVSSSDNSYVSASPIINSNYFNEIISTTATTTSSSNSIISSRSSSSSSSDSSSYSMEDRDFHHTEATTEIGSGGSGTSLGSHFRANHLDRQMIANSSKRPSPSPPQGHSESDDNEIHHSMNHEQQISQNNLPSPPPSAYQTTHLLPSDGNLLVVGENEYTGLPSNIVVMGEEDSGHKTGSRIGAPDPRYSNIVKSPHNEVPLSGRKYWHDSHLASIHIGHEEEPYDYERGGLNSAIIAILFGIGATGTLIMIVGHKMRTIRRRVAYKGRRCSIVPDTDFLISTMPI